MSTTPAQSARYPRWLVAIAGSAGALQPLRQLVDNLSPDMNAAYIVVIHYPQDAVSRLAEILARHAQVTVSTARDHDVPERGHVYVAPSGPNHVRLLGGSIRLIPAQSRHSPLANPLFDSVASAFGAKSIAVVLSGSSENGAAGVRTIKAAGGLVLVQSPLEAEHSRMPEGALRAASVDLCAGIAELSAQLRGICLDHPEHAGAAATA